MSVSGGYGNGVWVVCCVVGMLVWVCCWYVIGSGCGVVDVSVGVVGVVCMWVVGI